MCVGAPANACARPARAAAPTVGFFRRAIPPAHTLRLPSSSHTQPLKKPKSKQTELDDDDKAFLQKKKEEAAALKALKEKAASKGGFAKVKGSK